jgi:hypothetical protein
LVGPGALAGSPASRADLVRLGAPGPFLLVDALEEGASQGGRDALGRQAAEEVPRAAVLGNRGATLGAGAEVVVDAAPPFGVELAVDVRR